MVAEKESLALRVDGITKYFSGRAVVNGLSLEIAKGEIHGVVGANGSGKSTLIKILSGYHAADGGTIEIGGHLFSRAPRQSELRSAGVRIVHQDLGLVSNLSIAENFSIADELSLRPLRTLRDRKICAERLRRFGLGYSPKLLVEELSITEQVMVALVRSVTLNVGHPTLLVLDEATSGLPHESAAEVANVIRRGALTGAGVLFVSHRLDEILGLCDRITVLRDGAVVSTGLADSYDLESLAAAMFGAATVRELTPRVHISIDERPTRLKLSGVSGRTVRGINVDLREGEILGITGLINSGSAELGRLIFGIEEVREGTIEIDGRSVARSTPNNAIARGLAYVPASREKSLHKGLSIRENLTLANRRRHWRHWRICKRSESIEIARLLKEFHVHPAESERQLGTLSGGNQQKVALAKWIRCNPRVLILDEPCRGVDANARTEIYGLMREAAASGLSILVLTAEIEEIGAVCDRALILEDGSLVAELRPPNLNVGVIVSYLSGELTPK